MDRAYPGRQTGSPRRPAGGNTAACHEASIYRKHIAIDLNRDASQNRTSAQPRASTVRSRSGTSSGRLHASGRCAHLGIYVVMGASGCMDMHGPSGDPTSA